MAVNYYFQLDGVNGESIYKGHEGQMEILSIQWQSLNKANLNTSGSGAGKVDVGEITLQKYVDKGSTALFKAICSGAHMNTGLIMALKAAGSNNPLVYWKMSLSGVFITAQTFDFSSERPMETIALNAKTIKLEYFMQKPDGTLVSTGIVTYDRGLGTVT